MRSTRRLIGSKMLGTLPPVLYGIFRYLYLIYDRKERGRPMRSCSRTTA